MSSTPTKASVDAFSDLGWQILRLVTGESRSLKRPPVYFFNAPWSEGSLKKRNAEEIQLVHEQQFSSEGVTLIDPPASWVSDFDQIPEEVAHLFALTYQKGDPSNRTRFLVEEAVVIHRVMLLHEAFGRFGESMIAPSRSRPFRTKKRTSEIEDLWRSAHERGYEFGTRLAEKFFAEKIESSEIQNWFHFDWFDKRESLLAIGYLEELVN